MKSQGIEKTKIKLNLKNFFLKTNFGANLTLKVKIVLEISEYL